MTNQQYRCIPQRKGKRTTVLCGALLILSAVAFYASSFMQGFRVVGQLFSVVLLLCFVQLTTRYLLTGYEYILQGSTLSLYQIRGKNAKQMGSVRLTSDCRLFTEEEWEKQKKTYSVKFRLDLSQNLVSEEKRYLLFPAETDFLLVLLEPNAAFLECIREQILQAEGGK